MSEFANVFEKTVFVTHGWKGGDGKSMSSDNRI